MDIRGRVVKHREEGSDFFSTVYEGMRSEYLDAHIPGAVFVDWTKVGRYNHTILFSAVARLGRRGKASTADESCLWRMEDINNTGLSERSLSQVKHNME